MFVKDSYGETRSLALLRLPPAAFVSSLVTTDSLPDISQPIAPPTEKSNEPEPAIWTYPIPVTGNSGDVSRLIKFSREESESIYKVTKAHGRTITQVLSALTILTHAQAALSTSLAGGDERFEEVTSSFEKTEYNKIAINALDHRHKLPGGYDSLSSATSSPLFATYTEPLLTPNEGVKKLLRVDRQRKQVARLEDSTAFWDLLVPGVAGAWEKYDTRLESYLEKTLIYRQLVESGHFDPSDSYRDPCTVVSSIGNFDRLGILTKYHPSNSTPEGKSLTLTDVIFGFRNRGMGFSCFLYQVNGELSCLCSSALEDTSREMFSAAMTNFEEWIRVLFQVTK